MVKLPGRWNWRWVLSAPFPHARLVLRPPLTDRKKLASCGATSDGRRSDAGSGRAPPKSSSSNQVDPRLTLQLARTSAVTLGEAKCVAPKDRERTRLNSSHANIPYSDFCLKKTQVRN